MPIRTILIDDHRLFNDGLSLILRKTTDFVVVDQVYDSRLACGSCARHRPDLILIDFNMPHYDGLAVVEQLRQLQIPGRVVIVSMYADKWEISRLSALNIDGYIAKTVTADRLLLLLREVVQGNVVIETDPVPRPLPAGQLSTLSTHGLTKREIEILRRVGQGLTSEQIADDLGLTYLTVQTHRKNITQKLPFSTQTELHTFLETLT